MRLKVRQYLCKHDFHLIAKHEFTMQNLWRCDKCGVFCIQHYGIGLHYYSKTPELEHWVWL